MKTPTKTRKTTDERRQTIRRTGRLLHPLRPSGYYPAGAEFDPNAPYNRPDEMMTEEEAEAEQWRRYNEAEERGDFYREQI